MVFQSAEGSKGHRDISTICHATSGCPYLPLARSFSETGPVETSVVFVKHAKLSAVMRPAAYKTLQMWAVCKITWNWYSAPGSAWNPWLRICTVGAVHAQRAKWPRRLIASSQTCQHDMTLLFSPWIKQSLERPRSSCAKWPPFDDEQKWLALSSACWWQMRQGRCCQLGSWERPCTTKCYIRHTSANTLPRENTISHATHVSNLPPHAAAALNIRQRPPFGHSHMAVAVTMALKVLHAAAARRLKMCFQASL